MNYWLDILHNTIATVKTVQMKISFGDLKCYCHSRLAVSLKWVCFRCGRKAFWNSLTCCRANSNLNRTTWRRNANEFLIKCSYCNLSVIFVLMKYNGTKNQGVRENLHEIYSKMMKWNYIYRSCNKSWANQTINPTFCDDGWTLHYKKWTICTCIL